MNMADKIRKLMAQAESTHSEAERESAMAKAYELMARHAITDMDLEAAGDVKQSQIVIQEFKVQNPYAMARIQLLMAITKNTNVQIWYIPDRRNKTAQKIKDHFVSARLCGFQNDIDLTLGLFESLNIQMDSSMKTDYEEWLVSVPFSRSLGDKKVWKKSFLRSYANRINSRLTNLYRKEIESAGYGLALRDRGKQIQDHLRDNGVRLSRDQRSQHQSNLSGAIAGAARGQSASIGKSIGGG